MKALRLVNSGGASVLQEADVPQPVPGAGEVLVRVHAAGVTPTELLWYPTLHDKNGQPRLGAVPGHEFSGTVESAGSQADAGMIGQDVFGMNDWFAEGATAEYCTAPLTSIAPKPAKITHAEAATVPIGALTAWQGLFDRAHLKPGERVLVHGGAGAVGLLAVQLASIHGAHVIATVSARNVEFVSSLGAAEVIDYRAARFEDAARQVDVVFDTVGGETLERSWSLLSPAGRMITIASGAENAADPRIKDAFFIVEPNRTQLTEIAALLNSGRLKPVVDIVWPLSQASQAYSQHSGGKGRGKSVVILED